MDQNQSESIVNQPSIDYTQFNREIRVFLSSTFKDMDAERNYLLKHVFPELRAKCAERDVGFTEIDLRWGVTEEESKQGKTVELCLENIDRCREYPPFFIGFIGERYGWIPEDHHLDSYWQQQPKIEATGDYANRYATEIKAALKQGISVTELEMQFGVFEQPADVQANALFYLRDSELTKKLYTQAKATQPSLAESVFYSDSRPKDDALLAQLKAKIRASGHLIIDNYTSVESFGNDIREKLLAELDHRFPAEELPTYEERVLREHARYAQSRRQAYIALPSMRDNVNSVLQQQAVGSIASKPILITGVSGLGKSAFMADLQNELATDSTNLVLLSYFTGADGLSSLSAWRDMVFYQLRKQRGESLTQTEDNSFATADKPKQDDDAKWQRLSNELSDLAHSTQKTVVLLLDAINQMSQEEEAIKALQAKLTLPTNCRLVISSTPELTRSIDANCWVMLDMAQPTDEQVKQMIECYTNLFYKKLDTEHIELISHFEVAHVPLYLKLVLEDLRIRSHYETLTKDITELMALDKAEALLKNILLPYWDSDIQDNNHKDVITQAFRFIACSRDGLTENELALLLANEQDPIDPDTNKPKLPSQLLNHVLICIRKYLLRRDGREFIMHDAFKKAALAEENYPYPIELSADDIAYDNSLDIYEVNMRLYGPQLYYGIPEEIDCFDEDTSGEGINYFDEHIIPFEKIGKVNIDDYRVRYKIQYKSKCRIIELFQSIFSNKFHDSSYAAEISFQCLDVGNYEMLSVFLSNYYNLFLVWKKDKSLVMRLLNHTIDEHFSSYSSNWSDLTSINTNDNILPFVEFIAASNHPKIIEISIFIIKCKINFINQFCNDKLNLYDHYFLLSKMYGRLKLYNEEIASLNICLSFVSENDWQFFYAKANIAAAYYYLNEFESSYDTINSIIEINSDEILIRDAFTLSKLYYFYGIIQSKQEKIQGAVNALNRARNIASNRSYETKNLQELHLRIINTTLSNKKLVQLLNNEDVISLHKEKFLLMYSLNRADVSSIKALIQIMSEIGNKEQEVFWIRKLIKHTPIQHEETIDKMMEYYEYIAKVLDYYEAIDEKESFLLFLEETILKITPISNIFNEKDCIISFFATINAYNNCPCATYDHIDLLAYCKKQKLKNEELDRYLMYSILKALKNSYNYEDKYDCSYISICKSLHVLSDQIENNLSIEDKDFYFYIHLKEQIKKIPIFLEKEERLMYLQSKIIFEKYDMLEYFNKIFFNFYDLALMRLLSESYQRMGRSREARVLLDTINYFEKY